MDGRRFRFRLGLAGGLIVGGTVGCTHQTRPDDFTPPTPTPTPATAPPAGAFTPPPAKSSFFHKSAPAASPSPSPSSGVVQASHTTSGGKPKPSLPETDVAVAELRMDAAMADNQTSAGREQLLDQARLGLQKAIQKDPKNKAAHLGLARFYVKLGEKERAVDAYRRYFALVPKDHEVMHEVAACHARWGDFPGAAGWCKQALGVDPENRGYRKTMAFCLAHAGKWDEGFAVLCQVMPEAHARYNMAKVLQNLGQPDAGRQQLVLALKVDPSFTPAREFLAALESPAAVPTQADVRPAAAVDQAGVPRR